MEVNWMKSWMLSLGALVMVSGGCSPVVLDPLQGAQSTSATTGGGGGGGGGSYGGSGGGKIVLAMRGGDVNWQDNNSLSPGMGKPWSDPDSLVLFFSTDTQQCSDPVLPERCTGQGPFWQSVLAIPPELAHPGLISLSDPRIISYTVVSFVDGSPSCGGGGSLGPTLSPATLELGGDGSTTLSVKITGGYEALAGSIVNGVDQPPLILDGDYTGHLCSALPPAAPPTPALAVRGVDLPPPPGGGATPDPDSLVVFLGTLPDTCKDPWAAADCSNASRLTITIPPALQTPGMLSLSDPALAATYTRAANSGSSVCDQLDGAPVSGTIEILSVGPSGLTFKIYQSFSTGLAPTGWLYFDGLYSTSICP